MAGLPPIRARCEFLKLNHYLRILNRRFKSPFIVNLLAAQNVDYGYIKEVRSIFNKYNLNFIVTESEEWTKQAETIKQAIYRINFDIDLASISRVDSRGKVFSCLFHNASSYYKNKYKPLDLIDTVLDGQDREYRSAYFRFLSGYCFLFSNPGQKKHCLKCGTSDPDVEHYLTQCVFFVRQRVKYFTDVRKVLFNHNRELLRLFNYYVHSFPNKATLILLGANRILYDGNDTLIRDPDISSPQNNIPIITAHFAQQVIEAHFKPNS